MKPTMRAIAIAALTPALSGCLPNVNTVIDDALDTLVGGKQVQAQAFPNSLMGATMCEMNTNWPSRKDIPRDAKNAMNSVDGPGTVTYEADPKSTDALVEGTYEHDGQKFGYKLTENECTYWRI